MAFQKIDDRTILVTSTEQLPTLPDKPEPPRQADRNLDKKALMKKLGLKTDCELDEVFSFGGFPPAGNRLPYGEWTITRVWSANAVDRWVADQRAKATRILELLG